MLFDIIRLTIFTNMFSYYLEIFVSRIWLLYRFKNPSFQFGAYVEASYAEKIVAYRRYTELSGFKWRCILVFTTLTLAASTFVSPAIQSVLTTVNVVSNSTDQPYLLDHHQYWNLQQITDATLSRKLLGNEFDYIVRLPEGSERKNRADFPWTADRQHGGRLGGIEVQHYIGNNYASDTTASSLARQMFGYYTLPYQTLTVFDAETNYTNSFAVLWPGSLAQVTTLSNNIFTKQPWLGIGRSWTWASGNDSFYALTISGSFEQQMNDFSGDICNRTTSIDLPVVQVHNNQAITSQSNSTYACDDGSIVINGSAEKVYYRYHLNALFTKHRSPNTGNTTNALDVTATTWLAFNDADVTSWPGREVLPNQFPVKFDLTERVNTSVYPDSIMESVNYHLDVPILIFSNQDDNYVNLFSGTKVVVMYDIPDYATWLMALFIVAVGALTVIEEASGRKLRNFWSTHSIFQATVDGTNCLLKVLPRYSLRFVHDGALSHNALATGQTILVPADMLDLQEGLTGSETAKGYEQVKITLPRGQRSFGRRLDLVKIGLESEAFIQLSRENSHRADEHSEMIKQESVKDKKTTRLTSSETSPGFDCIRSTNHEDVKKPKACNSEKFESVDYQDERLSSVALIHEQMSPKQQLGGHELKSFKSSNEPQGTRMQGHELIYCDWRDEGKMCSKGTSREPPDTTVDYDSTQHYVYRKQQIITRTQSTGVLDKQARSLVCASTKDRDRDAWKAFLETTMSNA